MESNCALFSLLPFWTQKDTFLTINGMLELNIRDPSLWFGGGGLAGNWCRREAACFDTISPVQPFSTGAETSARTGKKYCSMEQNVGCSRSSTLAATALEEEALTELSAFVSSLPGKKLELPCSYIRSIDLITCCENTIPIDPEGQTYFWKLSDGSKMSLI